jgi:signal transduction histidine kinase/CheY-like chemotaxis protein
MVLNPKNTYQKILLLVFASSVFFLFFYGILFFFIKKSEQNNFQETQIQFQKDSKNIYQIELSSNRTFITEVTYWDEFVDFLKTKDNKWFKESVSIAFENYDMDYIVTFDVNKNLIIKDGRNDLNINTDILKKSISNIKQGTTIQFYKKTPQGIIEVIATSIHPSNDAKKLTKPSGYFYVVRLMNEKHLEELGNLSNSKITITDKIPSIKDKTNSEIKLYDENNKKIAILLFSRDYTNNFDTLYHLLFLIVVVSFLSLIIYFIVLRKLVNNPLELVTRILEKNDLKAVDELKQYDGEFGNIGKLFSESVKRKEELTLAKNKAEENDNLKSVFLANLSHEIRTPMNAILGFTNLLKTEKLNIEDSREYLETIEISGNNLVSIINDLIEMSKIDANQITPNYGSTNLEECINEIYETIKVTITNKKINFQKIEPKIKASKYIKADELKLKQIFINLINNAFKYTEKGTISFGYNLDEKNKQINFTVVDTGFGISKEDQNLIFDRFKRLENDYTMRSSGLGLGLAISKAYIEMMNGTISINSEVGKGTSFEFSLPLEYRELKPTETDDYQSDMLFNIFGNKKILVAEDDKINTLLFKKMLAQFKNIEIIHANNGKEAVELYQKNNDINMIFLDIKMPVMNGFEAFEEIRKLDTKIPVIAQTAYSSLDDVDIINKIGFTDYISKPISRDKLLGFINKYINLKNEN